MNKKGFTLVELIISLAIFSLILIITVPLISNSLDTGKNRTYEMLKENMVTAAENYLIECRNNSSSFVCQNHDWTQTKYTFTAVELLNNGFLTVSSDLISEDAGGKRIYNPSNNKDVSQCLKVTIEIIDYQYQSVVSDDECND